jgi:hypothetical protein
MWVYVGESLKKRLELNPIIGFWLDYWLFLHSEETHPVWNARPLGIRVLLRAAAESNTKHDAALRRQLKQEIISIIQLTSRLGGLPAPPTNDPGAGKDPWETPWLDWFEEVLSSVTSEQIISRLIQALAKSLAHGNLADAAYLTRRLAAEFGEDEWTKGQLFTSVKQTLCDSGLGQGVEPNEQGLSDLLSRIFEVREESSYIVTLNLAPVNVTQTAIQQMQVRDYLKIESNDDGTKTLTGISGVVTARHPAQAASIALEKANVVLDNLRLRYYFRTHLTGGIHIEKEGTDDSIWLSLSQPFWTKKPGRREVPSLPKGIGKLPVSLSDDDTSRLNAARWHLSQAFADWAEDSHGAAAKVWQALEAFAPDNGAGGMSKVEPLATRYTAICPMEIAAYIAARVSLQAREIKVILEAQGNQVGWYYWNAQRTDLPIWLYRVLNQNSTNCWMRWTPPAPLSVFDKEAGVLQIISRRIRNGNAERWMERRVKADLALLYGLRNKVVHGGQRILPRRAAIYLGQLGAEVIFTIIRQMVAMQSVNKTS